MKKIETKTAPKAVCPYSQAISGKGFVFCSGQIGIDPTTGDLVSKDVQRQTERVLKNLSEVLVAAGSDMSKVVKAEVFLADMKDYSAMNEAYTKIFKSMPQPARVTVAVSGLPKDALVEISCIALVKNNEK